MSDDRTTLASASQDGPRCDKAENGSSAPDFRQPSVDDVDHGLVLGLSSLFPSLPGLGPASIVQAQVRIPGGGKHYKEKPVEQGKRPVLVVEESPILI